MIYKLINDKEDLETFFEVLSKSSLIAINTEVKDLTVQDSELVGISICCQKDTSYYLPFYHNEGVNLNFPLFKNGWINLI